ncbi:hypothetical protein [Paenacidovorax caeni]|uniref:hypothetical protein n=1 Tax=Paenacidovorax caeni TaxID=343013 RepID=UPI0011135A9A|nr:hypothetical protein [Paenacidovorax caeni]
MLGTHGTCRSRAKEILDSQTFKASVNGYGGSGAYFWACVNGFKYGVGLAESWWAFSNHKRHYQAEKDASLAVLGATIRKPDDPKFFDATDVEFMEGLYSVMQSKRKNEDDLPEVTEFLIGKFQEKYDVNFQVIKMLVATPPTIKGRTRTYAQMISKASHAYLVKQSGINLIEKIELLDGGECNEGNYEEDIA